MVVRKNLAGLNTVRRLQHLKAKLQRYVRYTINKHEIMSANCDTFPTCAQRFPKVGEGCGILTCMQLIYTVLDKGFED